MSLQVLALVKSKQCAMALSGALSVGEAYGRLRVTCQASIGFCCCDVIALYQWAPPLSFAMVFLINW